MGRKCFGYASPYRTKDKTAIDAYPINSAMKKLKISSTEALELVFKNQYVPYAIASARQYKMMIIATNYKQEEGSKK